MWRNHSCRRVHITSMLVHVLGSGTRPVNLGLRSLGWVDGDRKPDHRVPAVPHPGEVGWAHGPAVMGSDRFFAGGGGRHNAIGCDAHVPGGQPGRGLGTDSSLVVDGGHLRPVCHPLAQLKMVRILSIEG